MKSVASVIFTFFLSFLSIISMAQEDSLEMKPEILSTIKKNDEQCFKFKNSIVAYSFLSYGFLRNNVTSIKTLDISTRNEIREDGSTFKTRIDDYLQWTPTVSLFMLDAAGYKTQHKFKEQVIIHLMATTIVTGTIYPLKKMTKDFRPDSSARNSFPSGHTATAFVGAEMLHQELKHSHPVLSYAGYLVASATGLYRMYNNKHWLSDVIAGAGFGMLSTKASYWIFDKIKCKRARKKDKILF